MASWPLQRDCAKFYGDPRTKSGTASAAWAKQNLVTVSPPWRIYFDGKPVAGCLVHRKVAESLARVFDRIWERCGRSQQEVDRIGMSVYAGGYVFRNMRGGRSLSMHSYGCAVDFDPARNGLGDKNPKMDRRVIEEFEREGWEWGGHWSRVDGMHFQAARTRAVPKRLPPAPAGATKTPAASGGLSRDEIAWAQRRLHTLGYHEVGFIDGIAGSRTEDAVRAFQRSEGLPVNGSLDARTMARISTADRRPVSDERRNVNAKDLRKTYAPLVRNFRTKVWAGIGAIFSAIMAIVEGIAEFFGEAMYRLDPVREFLGDIPPWVLFAAAAGIALAMYLSSDEADQAIVDQVRSGEAAGWSDDA